VCGNEVIETVSSATAPTWPRRPAPRWARASPAARCRARAASSTCPVHRRSRLLHPGGRREHRDVVTGNNGGPGSTDVIDFTPAANGPRPAPSTPTPWSRRSAGTSL
jgi:hypothetical protein